MMNAASQARFWQLELLDNNTPNTDNYACDQILLWVMSGITAGSIPEKYYTSIIP